MNILTPDFAVFASDAELIEQIEVLNKKYRAGEPLVTDAHFDALLDDLGRRLPKHPLVVGVQSALIDSKGRIKHPFPMLSTEKAYGLDEIRNWLLKVAEFCGESLDGGNTLIRISPKFDGCAGRYEPQAEHKLVTRGDGVFGNDFTKLIAHGLVFKGEGSVGEVIVDEEYFQSVLKPQGVAHPRNFVAGLISAENLSNLGLRALNDGAVHFVGYKNWSENVVLPLCEVLGRFEQIEADIIAQCPYRTDGVILQVDDEQLFASMGYGSKSHHGQLAKKIAGEPVEPEVTGVTWQIGRTGRNTPIVNILPTMMSGAMVTNITAHHAGFIRDYKIGAGSVILCVRSGEVIPYLLRVLKQSDNVMLPENCQCCNTPLVWQGDFLVCTNAACKGRMASQIEYTAKMLGIDLIGGKAAEKLADAGFGIEGFLSITDHQLQSIGFGAGQSANIIAEINRVKAAPIEDFKILASIGIHTLGRRASKSLLSEYPLDVLLSGISMEQVSALSGFADAKAGYVVEGVKNNRQLLEFLSTFFTQITPSKLVIAKDAPLVGLNVVFTGTLTSGSRNDVERNAEVLGAKVQSSVNGKTNYLVCGANVGASKTSKAAALGVKVISEAEYLQLISKSL